MMYLRYHTLTGYTIIVVTWNAGHNTWITKILHLLPTVDVMLPNMI